MCLGLQQGTMSFLTIWKQPRDNEPGSGGIASLAVLVAISILVIVTAITKLPMFVMSMFIPVEHPVVYSFPKYAKLLPEIVEGDFVNYQALKKSKLLDEAVSELGHVSPDSLEDSDQKFCFWLNSYNLLILKSIADKYPIENLNDPRITHIGANKFFIGGKPWSIEEIRRLQLLPFFLSKYPEALFLACGGCIGDPPLLNHVITPKNLKEDSIAAATHFVALKGNASYETFHKKFVLSPFFRYNDNIFTRYGGPHSFVNQLLPKERQLALESPDVLFKTYGKHLNTYLNDTALQHPRDPGTTTSATPPAASSSESTKK
jgi:hypothetical protein